MSRKDFTYTGDPIPQLTEEKHGAFLLLLQKALLYSLEKRNLLTAAQRDQCVTALEKKHPASGPAVTGGKQSL